MIIDKNIEITVSMKTVTHFRKLGYKTKINDIIEIKPNELTNGSHVKINVKCDICNKEKNIMYQKYIKNISNGGFYACSSKCAQEKVKNTSKENFGKEYYTQTTEYKESYKKTVFEKYGTEHHTQNEKVKEKNRNTCIEKYGVDNASKSEIVIEKIKSTFIEKYGVDNISKLDSMKEYLSLRSNNFDKFDVNVIKYNNSYYSIHCDKCDSMYNIHKKTLNNRVKRNVIPCTICNPLHDNVSELEKELLLFIKKNYKNNIIINSKSIIKPYELDIYLPELNLAFEFNGVYWHNELNKTNDYHRMKSDMCDEKNIQLIHIWEDDWIYKQDIVKSMILNKISNTNEKIYGRKTKVKEITDNKIIRSFLNNNHVQGFVGSSIKLGLYYENELISLMTFGKLRKSMSSSSKEGEFEMLRFCNKLNTNVIGGASKLFKYFIRNFDYTTIISYADRSHSNGNLYNQLKFKLSHITSPNYYYVIDGIRNYRYNFRKDILVKEGYDSNKTEHDIMLERKIYRIYNSGNYKFVYNN